MTHETQTDKMTPAAAPSAGAIVPYSYDQFAGTGYEDVADEKDLRPPFMAILQTNSKACVKGHQKHVAGAQPGMFLNTGTSELIPGETGFALVPLKIDHCVVEWAGDPGSGRFVARHEVDSPIYREAMARFDADPNQNKRLSKDVRTPAGNALVDTYYLWALRLDADGETPVGGIVLPFKSTNIAIYRNQVKNPLFTFKGTGGARPPLFAHRLRCTLAQEQRPAGISFNYRFAPLKGTVRDSLIDPRGPLMQAAYETFQLIQSGQAKLADDAEQESAVAESETRDEVFG